MRYWPPSSYCGRASRRRGCPTLSSHTDVGRPRGASLLSAPPRSCPHFRPTGLADLGPLRLLLAPGGRPLQDICDDAVNRLGNAPATGDAVLLLARTGVFPADQVASWDLDNQPESVGQARARTRRRLATWGVDDETAYTTELIVSELVTNAIRYGAPTRATASDQRPHPDVRGARQQPLRTTRSSRPHGGRGRPRPVHLRATQRGLGRPQHLRHRRQNRVGRTASSSAAPGDRDCLTRCCLTSCRASTHVETCARSSSHLHPVRALALTHSRPPAGSSRVRVGVPPRGGTPT